ncbi:MAG TPA: PilZ domain-containing protein [Myxococcaceae bacterium]|nr:PilZ domain-containing protein [Myxococcaceae bacterium]
MSERRNTGARGGRRRHQRVKPKGLVAIVIGDEERMSPVGDVSRGGLFLRTEESMPLGAAVSLELRRADRETAVPLSVRVVRQVPDATSGSDATHGLGILFDPMAPEVEAELVKLLEEAGHVELAPPPLPSTLRSPGGGGEPAFGLPEVPERGSRPEGDPFQEKPEPRMPRGGLPDEKIEHFRALVLQKSEALSRGGALFAEAVAEADRLHDLATQLRRSLELSLTQVEQGRATAREVGAFQARVTQLESELGAKKAIVESAQGARGGLERQAEHLREELAALGMAAQKREAALAEAERRADEADRTARTEHKQRLGVEESLARLEAQDSSLRKVRDELAAANRKAMEAQASSNRERRQREEVEMRLRSAEKVAGQLASEGNALKADLASLKKKLIQAEDALESAHSRSKARKVGAPR